LQTDLSLGLALKQQLGNLPLEKAKASTATTKVLAYLTQFMFHLRAIDFERKIYHGGEDN